MSRRVIGSCRCHDFTRPARLSLRVLAILASVSCSLAITADARWADDFGPHEFAAFRVSAFVVFQDELYAGGSFAPVIDYRSTSVVRWDGATWVPLLDGPQSSVNGFAVHDGDLVACSNGGPFGSRTSNHVMRWDGDTWSSMGRFNAPPLSAVVVGGSLYVGGRFTRFQGDPMPSVARWDGTTWHSVGGGIQGNVFDVGEFDGELIAAGWFPFGVLAWSGVQWRPFGDGLDDVVWATTVHAGQLVAGGQFTRSGSTPTRGVARWNGSTWESIGNGLGGVVRALSVHDGVLVAGGDLFIDGVTGRSDVAFWDGILWRPLGGGAQGGVDALHSFGTDLFAGGTDLSVAGSVAVQRIARWDGTRWSATHDVADRNGLDSWCQALSLHAGRVAAAGWFYFAGPVPAGGVALWDPSTWYPTFTNAEGALGDVRAVASFAGNLVIGGDGWHHWFRGAAIWDGVAWSGFPLPGAAIVDVLLDRGDELVFGGLLGTSSPNIARWDGERLLTLGSGFDHRVFALAEWSGQLVAGGRFLNSGATFVNHVAVWDESSWQPLGNGVDGDVYALADWNGVLVASGSFTTSGGAPMRHLAAWDGTRWNEIGGGLDGAGRALDVHLGNLAVGGDFVMAGSVAANHVALWNGVSFAALGSGTNDAVGALLSTGNSLYVGGSFTQAGNRPSHHIARWDDIPTDVIRATLQAWRRGNDAVLSWSFGAGALATLERVHVQRAAQVAGAYEPVTSTALLPERSMQFVDTGVGASAPVWYRLHMIEVDGAVSFSSPTQLDAAAIASHVTAFLHAPTGSRALGSVTVHYEIVGSGRADVRLDVYDVRGRLVRRLARGPRDAGRHAVVWQLSTPSQSVSRGIYLLRLQADDHVVTRKLVLAD